MQVVFDNPNSGTVHYVIDSICQKPLSSLKARKSNEEVIDYVAATPDAIGIIGANWISKADTTRLSFNQRVRVMSVSESSEATPENSYRPYQAYLALKQYPLTNEVYILINDPKGHSYRTDDVSDRRARTTDYPQVRTDTGYTASPDCKRKR